MTITLPMPQPGMVFKIYRSNSNGEPILIDTIGHQILTVPEELPGMVGINKQVSQDDCYDALAYMLKRAYGTVEQEVADELFLGKPPSCQHQWLTYDSGWTKYEYCKHCDEKKA